MSRETGRSRQKAAEISQAPTLIARRLEYPEDFIENGRASRITHSASRDSSDFASVHFSQCEPTPVI